MSFLGGALSGLLVLAVLGEGGATPIALFAIHLGLVLLVLAVLARPGGGVLTRAPLGAWTLFVAIVAAGAMAAPYGYAAVLVLVELAASFAVAVLAARVGPALVENLGTAVVWGAAFEGALCGYQRFVLGQERPAGTFLNPNHLGAWLVAAVVLGLGTRGRSVAVRRLALLPAGLGIFLCGSRGALVGAAAAALFLAVAAGRKMERRRRLRFLGAASILLAAASVGVAVRIARTPDAFAYHRLRIWKASLGAVAASPWTGSGPGQFKTAAANLNFPLDDAPLRYERFFISPHSDLLRVPCEVGWPAAAAFAAALLLAAAEIGRRMKRGSLPASALAAAAALVALFAQAAVDDLTDRPALYLLASALCGCLLARERTAPARAPASLRWAGAGIVVVAFTVGELSSLLAVAANDLPRGRLDPSQHAALLRALERNPLHPDAWLREAEHVAGDGSDWTPTEYARAREAAEHAVRLQPEDARYRLGLARIERLACGTLFRDEASRARTARAYDDARDRARHDPFLPLEEGRFLLATGDPAAAERLARRALEIEPGSIPPRLLLAEAILARADADALGRASNLLREAEEIAARARGTPRETPYARALLTVEPRWRDRLRAEVDSGASSP